MRKLRAGARGGAWLNALFLLILVSLSAYLLFSPGTAGTWDEFDVDEGVTAQTLAQQMKAAGFLQSKIPFLVWVRLLGAGPKIQIGRYKFASGRAAFWILDDLVHGRTQKVRVTIPEGFASWQIAERLEALKVCKGDAFRHVVAAEQLEGFLYPATYEFNSGLAPAKIAHALKDHFDQKWTPDLETRAREWGWGKKETVTMASILEREVRVRDELPLVSALYHNRLKKHMRLQADPTVQYALGHWAHRLTYDDYKNTDSPYNTYLHDGLPPGPVCSPGMDAVRAALWPSDSDALYMVAGDGGRHNFSSTYRDHTNKVNRRNRRARAAAARP